jgi:N-hydroxyarylamine O-acetyltransferase
MSSPSRSDRVAPELVERVLEKLGLREPPSPDLSGLAELYSAWCRGIPFDNVRKLIWLREEIPGPLPGDAASDFLESWLLHGTGGTCWAGNGALHALLVSLGFEARRGYATMLVAPDIPPNHGTVSVEIEDASYLVDASILFHEPIPLVAGARIDHPAWGVRLHNADGNLRIAWRAFHMDPLECRIDSTLATREDFESFHEATRSWGPFNYSLSARRIDGDEVIGASFGKIASLNNPGPALLEDASPASRKSLLVDRLGISEEMADRLPDDQPLPAPPPRPA